MQTYAEALGILREIGYSSFMPLQEKAFRSAEVYDPQKDIFVTGDTSSGKTLIPLICYLLEKKRNSDHRMLFLVPYRALASQKKDEIAEILHAVLPGLRIVLSSGECREDDADITAGNVDVAVIIYEKAYHIACASDEFLKSYQTVVYDEFALSEDDCRGASCDLMLLLGQKAGCRRVVLSTPHYRWRLYIHNGGFFPVQQNWLEGGVPREEKPIFLDATSKSGKLREFHDLAGEPIAIPGIRNSGTLDDLIEDLCVRHLQMHHRILVFMNNCDEVRRMAGELSSRLNKHHPELLNQNCQDADASFHQVLEKTGALEEDLAGLMNPQECLAFAQGICYHNSWLGYDLRMMIEREIFSDQGCLKVLFCTETMAYGINSNVDVVIVADMHKSIPKRDYIPEKDESGWMRIRGESKLKSRFLLLNEYQNYIGRAGRFGRAAQGYAYALMTQKPGKASIRKQWCALLNQRNAPKTAESTLLTLDPYCNREKGCQFYPDSCKYCSLKANEFAMPVLSLITAEGVTYQQIKRQLMSLPGLDNRNEWLDRNLNTALNRLIYRTRPSQYDKGWVAYKKDMMTGEGAYYLTNSGQIMSGFMVTMYEANVMLRYLLGMRRYMPEGKDYTPDKLRDLIERDPFDLIYQLCYLPELQKIAFEFFEISDIGSEEGMKKRDLYQKLCTERLRIYNKRVISQELYRKLMYTPTNTYNYRQGIPSLYRTMLSIMVYEWYRNASVFRMQSDLNAEAPIVTITPGRISRLSQQVSFYLQMTEALCKTLGDPAYGEIAQLLNHMEMCLYFGIRAQDARTIEATYLRRLTRQQQMKVAQILDFCANHPSIGSLDELTRRQKNDWKSILRSLNQLPEDSEIPGKLREAYPVLNTARALLMKG